MNNGPNDIAQDLLIDLQRADQTAVPGESAEDRRVVVIMRRNGISEADIAAALGLSNAERDVRPLASDDVSARAPG